MRLPAVLLTALFALACVRPATTPSPARTTAAITAEELRTRLYIFADDSMLGRQAGTDGNVKATDYIVRELRRIGGGLEPAGDDGTFFQTIPLMRFANAGWRPGEPVTVLGVDGAGEPLVLGSDYIAAYSSRFPPHRGSRGRLTTGEFLVEPLRGAPVIYGGVFGDTSAAAIGAVTPAQAAGKLVIFTTRPDSTGERTYTRISDTLTAGRWRSAATRRRASSRSSSRPPPPRRCSASRWRRRGRVTPGAR